MSEEKSAKRKLFDKLLEWAFGKAKEQLGIAKKVGKKFFWIGFVVGGLAGVCVGSLLTWLVVG